MKVKISVLLCVLCIMFFKVLAADPEEIYVVAAAGYKLPVTEVIKQYEADSGQKVNAVFGNMQMITTYVKQSADVSVIIGDSNFIKKSGIILENTVKIGRGRLLVVYQPSSSLGNVTELTDNKIKRIGIPDPKKAIYGKAAVELLKAVGIYEKVADKLIILKTVPQVSAYLQSGDIDVGLINTTDYVKLEKTGFKSLEVAPDLYSEIIIQAGMIKQTGGGFMDYICSDKGRKIFAEYGL